MSRSPAEHLAGSALRDDAAIGEDDHLVGSRGKLQRVGYEDRRAAGHQGAKAGDHRGFALGVQPGGRFVEDEDVRVAHEGAGEADPLALAAGEPDSLRAELGLVAVGETADEAICRDGLRRGDDSLAGGAGAVGDVLLDRPREQHRVLKDEADLRPQPGERAVAGVAAVDQHPAAGRVVQADDQRPDRRLPGPGFTHDRYARPRRDAQVDRLEHGALRRVAEAHILEGDVAMGRRPRVGARPILDELVGGQDLGDPVGASHRARHLRPLARDSPQRAVQPPHVGGEHHEVARRELAVRHPHDAETDDERRGDRRHHPDQAVEAGLQSRHLDPYPHALSAPSVHAVALEPLGSGGLDDRHRGEGLARQRSDHALVRALDPRALADPEAVAPAEDCKGRQREEGDEGEDWVDDNRDHRHAQEQEGTLGDRPERGGEELADRGDVLGHPSHEVAFRSAVVVAEREPVQVLVDGDPHRVRDPLPRAVEPQVGEVVGERLGERDHDHEADDGGEQAQVGGFQLERRVAVADDLIERERERPRLRQLDEREHDGRGRCPAEGGPLGPKEWEQGAPRGRSLAVRR